MKQRSKQHSMAVSRFVVAAIVVVLLFGVASPASADHERFFVGEMRDTAANAEWLSAITGECIPTHDRVRLDCTLTQTTIHKAQQAGDIAKRDAEFRLLLSTRDGRQQFQKELCTVRVEHPEKGAAKAKKIEWDKVSGFAPFKAFCDRPTAEAALAVASILADSEAKTCRIVTVKFRQAFTRHFDRWTSYRSPEGFCGVTTVSTLRPHSMNDMNKASGPVLWTLDERSMVTRGEGEFCNQLKDETRQFAWNAPKKELLCGVYEFNPVRE